ncbi:hypothetical protein HED60_20980 [Planctomycetales bacterium ZRK34]|nr:hypothetical protein HED60_20980 [Planctomycetales bacterium ZRK34]
MDNWQLHVPSGDNQFSTYACGLKAGQRVALKKDLIIRDHQGVPTGEIHPEGEVWVVLRGVRSDPVLWFDCPDGERCSWDDDINSVQEWFEVVESTND